jgi:Flp pilus assembly protein TadD
MNKLRIFSLLIPLLLSACGHSQHSPYTQTESDTQRQLCGGQLDAGTSIKLDLITQLMDEGRLHAALAHLDNLDSDSLQARYLRAEILRRSGRDQEAKPYYQGLLDTCMVGSGYHGLGLIAGRDGQLQTALDYLQSAAERLPVDARVRNDFGYALLLDGQFERARREFLTAMELDEGAGLAQTNMVMLLYVADDGKKAEAFASRINMDADTLAQLREQSATIKTSITVAN